MTLYDTGRTYTRGAGRDRASGRTAANPRVVGMSDRFTDLYAAVRTERRRCAGERESFESFRSALADVETVGGAEGVAAGRSAGPAAVHAVGAARTEPDDGVRRVCEAYRRTVMAVPHYDEEYGESLAENLAQEFGADVAAAMANASVLTDDLRDAVDDAAAASQSERDEFVGLLDREESSLETVERRLGEVADRCDALDPRERQPTNEGFDELRERYEEIRDLRERLDELAAHRQRTLAAHRRTLSDGVPSVTEFLYPDADEKFPVLAGVAEAGERLDAVERRLTDQLARRC